MAGASTDEEAGAIGVIDEDGAMAGASTDEEAGAIGVTAADEDGAMAGASTDEEAGAIGVASEDEAGAIGAADDDTTTAELDGAVLTTAVLLPRLKIQMRPMITITATMMIIQVLRFMGLTLGSRRVVREE